MHTLPTTHAPQGDVRDARFRALLSGRNKIDLYEARLTLADDWLAFHQQLGSPAFEEMSMEDQSNMMTGIDVLCIVLDCLKGRDARPRKALHRSLIDASMRDAQFLGCLIDAYNACIQRCKDVGEEYPRVQIIGKLRYLKSDYANQHAAYLAAPEAFLKQMLSAVW